MKNCILWVIALSLCLQTTVFANSNNKTVVEQMLAIVNEKALVSPQILLENEFNQILNPTSADINNFLTTFDKWASWTSKEDHLLNADVNRMYNSGIGLEVIKSKNNKLVCIPYPNKPAANAGILENDILVNVDTYTVTDVSLADIAVLVRGEKNTVVDITVQRGEELLTYKVKRENLSPAEPEFYQHDGFARIRIWYFEKNTKEKFRTLLKKVGNQPLVIDLRGNSGGSLVSGLSCASEFLPKNTLLSIAQKRTDITSELSRTRSAENGKYFDITPLYIWQNELTASAAEAFTAALVDNHRAVSVGLYSFGKSFAQSVFSIERNTLTITTERLMSPKGVSWASTGLQPTYFCDVDTLDEFISKTSNNLRNPYNSSDEIEHLNPTEYEIMNSLQNFQ